MSMETGAIIVSQNFAVSAYQERLAMEVLTCVNNLQSRCDMFEDASAILGCAACCSGIKIVNDGRLLDNCLQKNYLCTNMVANTFDEQPFIGPLHSSSIISNTHFLQSNAFTRQLASDMHAKRLRKRSAGFSDEETAKKKGRANHLESLLHSSDTLLASFISAEPQLDKRKSKAAKLRKGKDSSNCVKVDDEKYLSKAPEGKIGDETDKKMAALEWQQCVSLLKRYGVIGNPHLGIREGLNRFVPHPGRVGDGLQEMMCKICGMAEDADNTVICDNCQEAFHLSCCVPRLTSKYFKREDNWFCASCRKQRRKIGPKFAEKGSNENKSFKVTKHTESKARVGPAHQADVPDWQERALNGDAERCVEGCLGMEIGLTEEEKDAERDHLLRSFSTKLELLRWVPASKVHSGTPQNWVKCNNVIMRGYKTADGRKQNEVVCGKWRRAPLNVEQTDEWECFCALEWDPLHADCSIPQECSDEEVFSRTMHRWPMNKDVQNFEAGGRKSTLRHGKLVI